MVALKRRVLQFLVLKGRVLKGGPQGGRGVLEVKLLKKEVQMLKLTEGKVLKVKVLVTKGRGYTGSGWELNV